jgi:hypothetical protein
LNQAAAVGFAKVGFTPATQFVRFPLGEKTTPAESQELVSVAEPLWIVVIVPNCQPPNTRSTMPP